jgi:hypothetical protein
MPTIRYEFNFGIAIKSTIFGELFIKYRGYCKDGQEHNTNQKYCSS